MITKLFWERVYADVMRICEVYLGHCVLSTVFPKQTIINIVFNTSKYNNNGKKKR